MDHQDIPKKLSTTSPQNLNQTIDLYYKKTNPQTLTFFIINTNHVMTITIQKKKNKQKSPKMDQTPSSSSSSSSCSKEGNAEIVFFDLETTVPNRKGKRFWVLEFGAIVVCPMRLIELESYTTLIRPTDLSVVSLRSGRCHGITREKVANAPTFGDVADKIFGMLNGRVWAGHNINRFDCVRIKEAFRDIGRDPPLPLGLIDSLGVLSQKFGKRAGNMKMASLGAYFGLGTQKHRSLDDVRMNLEVLKHCATVLLLESSLPSILDGKWQSSSSPTVTTRSRSSNGAKLVCREEPSRKSQRAVPYNARGSLGQMTARVKNLLCKAQESTPMISNLLMHTQTLLR